jgi:hypothetical protein
MADGVTVAGFARRSLSWDDLGKWLAEWPVRSAISMATTSISPLAMLMYVEIQALTCQEGAP